MQLLLLLGILAVICGIIGYVSRPNPTKTQNINRAINQLDADVAKLRNKHKF